MKIVIAGGGTAGHVYPGLALAKALKASNSTVEITWIGTPKGIEAKLVADDGYDFIPINAKGLQNRFSFKAIKIFLNLIRVYFDSKRILKKHGPKAVIGMGGYVSLPVLLAASKRYSSFILEQNAVPSLTNRILSPRVDAAILTYDESKPYFRTKNLFTSGNPVRAEIKSVSREEAAALLEIDADRFTVLVFGGSGGARHINQAMIEGYDLFKDIESLQIVHITGNIEFEKVAASLKEKKGVGDRLAYHLYPYITDMWLAYAVSDLAICRAGATTLAEISAAGLPAILIPYPYATEDHQTKNALVFEKSGAAKLVDDHDLNGELLWQHIKDIKSKPDVLLQMANSSQKMSHPEAADKAADYILSLINKK